MTRPDGNRIRDGLASLVSKARNNPDYAGAVISGYGLVFLQMLVQVLLIPLYLSSLGVYLFGLLMVVFGIVTLVSWGIRWLQGVVLVAAAKLEATGDRLALSRLCAALYLAVGAYALTAIAVAIAVLALLAAREMGGDPEGIAAWSAVSLPGLFAAVSMHIVSLLGLTVELWILIALRRQMVANLILILSLAVAIPLLVAWLLGGGSLPGVISCLAVGSCVGWVLAVAARRRRLGLKIGLRSFRGAALLARSEFMGRQGRSFFFYGMLALAMLADVPIIGFLMGPDEASRLVLVWKIAEVAVLLLWRLVDHLKPEIIMMQQAGQAERLRRVYRHALMLVRLLAAAGGILYALLGPWLVGLWVGPRYAPDEWWAYALAGAAIFWLGTAYLPESFAYSLGRIGNLARLKAVEVSAKLVLLLAFLPWFGAYSPLLALSAAHLGGIALAYVILGRRLMAHPPPA